MNEYSDTVIQWHLLICGALWKAKRLESLPTEKFSSVTELGREEDVAQMGMRPLLNVMLASSGVG